MLTELFPPKYRLLLSDGRIIPKKRGSASKNINYF